MKQQSPPVKAFEALGYILFWSILGSAWYRSSYRGVLTTSTSKQTMRGLGTWRCRGACRGRIAVVTTLQRKEATHAS